jgi:hypothetical protein
LRAPRSLALLLVAWQRECERLAVYWYYTRTRVLEARLQKLEARDYMWFGQMADTTPKRLILGTLFVHCARA